MIKITKRKYPIIGYRINVIVFDKVDEFRNKFSQFNFSHENFELYQGFTFEHEDEGYIAIKVDDSLKLKHIVHECKHLLNQAFKWMGYELDLHNDELECYFLEWTFDEVYKIVYDNAKK